MALLTERALPIMNCVAVCDGDVARLYVVEIELVIRQHAIAGTASRVDGVVMRWKVVENAFQQIRHARFVAAWQQRPGEWREIQRCRCCVMM